jgi:dTDP-4-amino-4,6-dideoxygalactose transaminase
MIPVTKSFLPPFQEYVSQVKRSFDNEWLTNRGELVKELEFKLCEYLEMSNIIITNNGTIPLQIAIKLLANNGEVITTPFSYIATTSSIIWENCTPVFVDIDPISLTIDESKIESAITSRTTCILATHVFGNPCDVDEINRIANKYNLHVIYDAAHCFGVKYKDVSIFNYGDVSTCSFHATKLFHTAEGGAMFSNNLELLNKLYYSHNFGHNGPLDFHGLGINGKISELQASMGLAVLPYIDEIIVNRKKIVEFYLLNLNFAKISKMILRKDTTWNYSYFPVIFEKSDTLLRVQKALNDELIYPRRYFYPSLNTIPFVKGTEMTVSESISSRILCLPLYVGLDEINLLNICNIINENI